MLREPGGGGGAWAKVHSTLANAAKLSSAGPGVEAIREALGADEISLSKLVVNRGERWMAVVAFGAPHATEWWSLSEHPAVERTIRRGIPRQVADTDPTADPGELEVLFAGGYRALLMLPIEFEGVELGVLEVYSQRPRRWNVGDIAHARAACNQLSTLMLLPSGRRAETTAAVLERI